MKARCPHCGAHKAVTFKQADSGEPIICPGCGKDMHLPDWQPEKKGGQK